MTPFNIISLFFQNYASFRHVLCRCLVWRMAEPAGGVVCKHQYFNTSSILHILHWLQWGDMSKIFFMPIDKATLWHSNISDNRLAGTNVFQKRCSMICATVMTSSNAGSHRLRRLIENATLHCDGWPPSGELSLLRGKYWIGMVWTSVFLCTCYVIISHWNAGAQVLMDKIARVPNFYLYHRIWAVVPNLNYISDLNVRTFFNTL
jgi:hypothetical protein